MSRLASQAEVQVSNFRIIIAARTHLQHLNCCCAREGVCKVAACDSDGRDNAERDHR